MVQNQLSSTVIHASGRYHVVTACSAVNLLIYLGLAFLLVPRLGPLGAALATLGTESTNAVVQLMLVRRWIRGPLLRGHEARVAGTLTAPRAMP
jgi:O-antigen/teichoic acid export membrane protein